MGSPSMVPCLNHDRQGDVHAVRGKNVRRCREKSATALSVGANDDTRSSDIFRSIVMKCFERVSVIGKKEPCP